MNWLWLDGEVMLLEEGRVSVEDRALQFADGIYEVIAAYDGEPVLLREHLERWQRSADGLRIVSPWTRDERHAAIMMLIARHGGPRAMVYGQLSRGSAKRSHAFPKDPHPTEFWYVRDLPVYKPEYHAQGVATVLHPDERWTRCWIKSTCLLPNVLAKEYATERGAFEAILVRENGTITEGSSTNVWIVKDGAAITHPLDDRILGGVVRGHLIDAARAAGIAIREETFDKAALLDADEVFITSTTINVMPVASIDGAAVKSSPGPLTRRLAEIVESYLPSAAARN